MKNSKETRTCIACKKKENKTNLIRIVKSKNEEIKVDILQNLEGRGAYVCKSEECFKKLMKNKALSRAFKMNISDEKYNELRGVMFDKRG